MSHPPLVIVDLPDRSLPGGGRGFPNLVNAALGEAEEAIRNFGYVSLAFISGINMIELALGEKDTARCIELFRLHAHPQDRLHTAYRLKPHAYGRIRLRRAQRALRDTGSPEYRAYLANLALVYTMSLNNYQAIRFSAQLHRLIRSLTPGEVHIYSLLEGDFSHIDEIIWQAGAARLPVRVRTPRAMTFGDSRRIGRSLGIETVEGLA
jgi:hypothetical protein